MSGSPPPSGEWGKRGTYAPPAWTVPLLILAMAAPISAAFMLGGAAAGLATGALVTGSVIFMAARMTPDEPIDAAPGIGAERILAVLDREPGERELEALADLVERDLAVHPECSVRLVAPTRPGPVDRWATDLAEAQADAQLRLVHASAALARAGLDAEGRIGDADAVQATTDELRSYPASRVVLISEPGSEAAAALERRLQVPLTVIDGAV